MSQSVKHLLSKLPRLFSWVTVEPAAFFLSFALGLSRVSNANLFADRTCLEGSVIFGNGTTFDEATCNSLSDNENEEKEQFVEMQVGKRTLKIA